MEALLIIGAIVAGANYIDKGEENNQLIDPNPAVSEILYTGKGQYVHNQVVQNESEVQWIISTN
jgi:hypothetical protein